MKYTIFTAIIILVSSCHSKNNNWGFKEQNLNISDLTQLKTNLDYITTIQIPSNSWKKPPSEKYNLIDTIFAVKLETNRNNIIGHIDDIKIYKNRIYVLDKRVAKIIYAFDLNGKFINSVGKKGKGPGEYLHPEGIEIDKINNELIVVSVANRKFLRFDLDGKFLGEFDIEVAFKDFKILNNGNFVLLAGDELNSHLGEDLSKRIVYITDNRGKIIGFGPKSCTDFENVKIQRAANLMVQNNEISFCYKFSDTIFQVNNHEIRAKYKIDLGSFALDREKLKNKNTQDFISTLNKINSNPEILFSGNHFQTNDYLFFSIDVDRSPLAFFYNKNNKKLFIGMINPYNPYYLFDGKVVSSYKDYFIGYRDSYSILSEVEQIKKNNPSQLNLLFKNMGLNKEFDLSESDNPVLFFYKLKK